jgi:hypothetical protein
MVRDIRTARVENMGRLISALRDLVPDIGRSEYWFRGHARLEDWSLVASVHRFGNQLAERQLTLRFQVGAVGRTSRCPAENDFGSWLVLMQHYGLPSRLLDWTRSLIVAAYFAVAHEDIDADAAIWLLAPERLNECAKVPLNGIGLLNGGNASTIIRPIAAAAFRETECEDSPYAVLSQDLDMRVLVQSGAFTIHNGSEPLNVHPFAGEFLARFDIPSACRADFQAELWTMGARRSLLFPDLHHLAIELAQTGGHNIRVSERQI